MTTKSRLSVITGPRGVDIGHAVATIGRRIDDGLAVRVVDSDRDASHRTSPDPFHGPDTKVRLAYLPSAWQDPQTNLGVVFTGRPQPLADDIHTMASLGLNPSHRLTVQSLGPPHLGRGYVYPLPIEVGNVGVHARDAVLRAGGHVLIEAGDGMTHLEALASLGLAPWAPWIGMMDLWTVFDVRDIAVATSPGEHIDADLIAARVADGLTQLGALIADTTSGVVTSRVVVLGFDDPAVLPGVEDETIGSKILARVGTGVDAVHVGLWTA